MKPHPVSQAWQNCLYLAEQVVAVLQRKNLHMTCVESCTGGGLAHALTCIPGASRVFESGFVTYSAAAKIQLGVSEDSIQRYTVYSKEVAVEMAAAGLKKSIHADLSVATTGVLTTVDPDHIDMKPGIVHLAIATKNQVFCSVCQISESGSRDQDKEWVISFAFQKILESLK
jgi:PncC family amidohydrolase